MPAARGVRVGELVYEDELRRAHDRGVQIELGEGDAVVLDELVRHLLEAPARGAPVAGRSWGSM